MGYRITKRGAVTIPSEIRKRRGFEKGSKVAFLETDEGVLIVPVIPLEDLCGVDKDREVVVHRMIRELHAEHRRDASGQGHTRGDGSCDRGTRGCRNEDAQDALGDTARRRPGEDLRARHLCRVSSFIGH